VKEFERWLHIDLVNEKIYVAEYHDCDDFSRALRCAIFKWGHDMKTTLTVAYAEGYALDTYHAFNLLIDERDRVWIVEPQSDIITAAGDSEYVPDFIQF
jgi:hypothetical protein